MAKRKKTRTHRPLGGAVYRVKRSGEFLAGWFGRITLPGGQQVQRKLTKDEDDRDGAEVALATWALETLGEAADVEQLREFATWALAQTAESPRSANFHALATRALEIAKEQKSDPETGLKARTLAKAIDECLIQKESEVSAYHQGTLAKQLKRFLAAVGDVPLANVTRATVDSYLAALGKQEGQSRAIEGTEDNNGKRKVVTEPLSPNTQRHHLSALGTLFAFAVDRSYIATNPARGVKLKRVQQHEAFVLTNEALAKLYAHLPEQIRDAVVLLGESGARFGEIANIATAKNPGRIGLQWDEVDTDSFASITLTRATKSYKNRRVPLTSRASDLLRSLHARRVIPLRGSDPVFAPVSKERFGELFRDARRAAGLPQKATIHSLRHSYCVALTMANVPFSVSAKILGHSTPAFTASRYGRWVPDGEEARAVAALDRARSGAVSAVAKTA